MGRWKGTVCPAAALHTHDPTEPTDYAAWDRWAAKKAKTHIQRRCPTCKLWLIWEKRHDREESGRLAERPRARHRRV